MPQSVFRGRSFPIFFLLAFSIASFVRADVANLAVTSDTFILSSAPGNNGGGHSHVAAGRDAVGGIRRGLFQFATTNIPPGSVVTSVTFSVDVVITPNPGPVNSTFDILKLAADWAEGSQSGSSGSAAASGECTWSERMQGFAPWTNPGGDFDATALASTFVSGNGSYSWSDTGLVAAVQEWIDNPAQNFGLSLRSQAEGVSKSVRGFGSREGASPAALDVGFDPPPRPAIIGLVNVTTNLTITWTNSPGKKYDVLFTRNLANTQDWIIAEANIPGHPSGTNIWDDPPYLGGPFFPTNKALWYAVRELPASPSGMPVRLDIVASNLISPTVLTHAGDGSDRLFVCDQRGKILIVDSNRTLLPTPFLDITSRVVNLSAAYDERGLLGLAFHPAYTNNGKFYVYFSATKSGAGINHESILSEFLVTATNINQADPVSERIVLRFDQPQNNHNGGSLAFGPDGFLYISTGDGGGADDAHPPYGNAQNISNLLGKILRIDVDSALPYAVPPDNPLVGQPGARDEIFALGFRNPWKTAFDGTNCWVADVGQNVWEEIDLLRKGGNYGWRIIEGNHAFVPSVAAIIGVDITALDYPIHEYVHGPLGISIIGGSVYRGANYPALQGKYVFGDFSTGFFVADGAIYYLEESRTNIWERFKFHLAPGGGSLNRYVKGFGSDERGEIYLLSSTNLGPAGLSGDIRQLVPP